jgi:hypothetical protein
MNIRIRNKWLLSSTANNFEVSDIMTQKTGKHKGEEILINTQYPSSIDSALNNVFKRCLLISDATTLAELLNEVRGFRIKLKELFER